VHRARRYALIAVGALFTSPVHAQSDATFGLERGEHAVGFRLLDERDPARFVTGGNSATPHARPLRIYLWYPAASAPRPVTFGRYAALADDDVWPAEIVGRLHERLPYARRSLARSLSSSEYQALLQRPMRAGENADPASGAFPLVVIGQGLYYESPTAFAAFAEYLAGRGFVVATTPLVGTHSPLVKLDVQDLQSQVRDLEAVIAHVRAVPFVSRDTLGVLGFDMGGMVGLILSMRNRDVDAFASLDSGILFPHPSGLPRNAPDYDPLALRVPWLHAMTPRGDLVVTSLFDEAVHAERFLLRTQGMNHVDYTSYSLVVGRDELPLMEGPRPESTEDHRAVAHHVRRFFAATLADDSGSRRFLADSPELGPRMTWEYRQPTPPSITYDALIEGGRRRSRRRRGARAASPRSREPRSHAASANDARATGRQLDADVGPRHRIVAAAPLRAGAPSGVRDLAELARRGAATQTLIEKVHQRRIRTFRPLQPDAGGKQLSRCTSTASNLRKGVIGGRSWTFRNRPVDDVRFIRARQIASCTS
jgi:hypothetical protein